MRDALWPTAPVLVRTSPCTDLKCLESLTGITIMARDVMNRVGRLLNDGNTMRPTALLVLISTLLIPAAALSGQGFDVVVLGALGGIQDGNLSSYLIRPHGNHAAITCDAGSLVNGLKVAQEKGVFADVRVPEGSTDSVVGHVLKDHIKGYLISHAHLDHVEGLVIASPDDSNKTIYGLPSVNARLEQNYFNWVAWPNMLDRGQPPQLKKYHVADLVPGLVQELAGTRMAATPFPLSHAGSESTAFLIESGGDAILCFGDTGPDEVENSSAMQSIWKVVADKVKQRRLKAIILEVSYTNDRPDNLLFGHMTPKWVHKALHALGQEAGGDALKGLPVIVSHIKYSLTNAQPQDAIRKELEAGNDLGVRFLIPGQGELYHFP
ncbi:MBL fold metallo-hydrolase [Microvirga puerhi]|uniref:3',5'-cyclic-nucleotide phosphodiesterase n=1 Tax=Microvirga puerhi TaxID=2876078 RepID=A0ABS7VTT4_9HYPH|nr:3',5'-cyclic-nucleotide phosphodiesterase [Microvirga puerhi]MBZ6078974.1 3',5'-cyclic-nucleotide phosphodiesterase [Microvirga puerhi]